MKVVAVADDLSGAAETAVALGQNVAKIWLFRSDSNLSQFDESTRESVLAIDSDLRVLGKSKAKARLERIERQLNNLEDSSERIFFFKVDSLLRGHVSLIAASCLLSGPTVVAVANPRTGRTTVNGHVFINGVPLDSTGALRAESLQGAKSVFASVGSSKFELVTLSAVRSSLKHLSFELKRIAQNGSIAICDAETADDLERIARAGASMGSVRFIGSAGLAVAISTLLAPEALKSDFESVSNEDIAVLVGSRSKASLEQVAKLRKALPISGVTLSVGDFSDSKRASLVLTGGETARRALDLIGAIYIRPIAEIEAGMIASVTDTNRLIITKPGSYGDSDSLIRAIDFIKSFNSKKEFSK